MKKIIDPSEFVRNKHYWVIDQGVKKTKVLYLGFKYPNTYSFQYTDGSIQDLNDFEASLYLFEGVWEDAN